MFGSIGFEWYEKSIIRLISINHFQLPMPNRKVLFLFKAAFLISRTKVTQEIIWSNGTANFSDSNQKNRRTNKYYRKSFFCNIFQITFFKSLGVLQAIDASPQTSRPSFNTSFLENLKKRCQLKKKILTSV